MNSNVYMKSYANGLKVFLDETCSFEDIIKETGEKFLESKNFFKGGKIAISFEGRKLSSEEERELTNVIEQSAEMTILYILGKDEENNRNFLKAVERPVPGPLDDSEFGKFYYGNLKKNMIIESEHSVIVVGDVEPGAKIVAKGNVIILGGLYGSVILTGGEEASDYFIAAFDVSAENIIIGDYSYFSKEKPKWVVKPKMVSKIAYVTDNQVVLANISKETINELLK